jgi:hypothetical protein
MTYDNTCPGNFNYENSSASPDSHRHLDIIRDEVRNTPQDRPQFYGLNIGIAKLGFTDDGAFNPGVNLGIVHAQVKVGLVNGADAGVNLGPLAHAGAGVYAGVDRNGFKGNAGAGADVLGLVGGHGAVDTRLGNATGASVDGAAHFGPIGARSGAGAALGADGLDAAVSGGAHAGRLLGAHAGGYLGLNDNSQVDGGVGANLGDLRGSTAGGVYTDGNSTIRPDIYAHGRAGYNRGFVDLNPPLYGSEEGYPPGYASGPNGQGPNFRGPSDIQPCPPDNGLGKQAPIEVRQLPPVYEAATPANIARVQTEALTRLCENAKYTVQKGDTFKTIAAKLMPGADQAHLDQEAQKLHKLHEDNGYKSLKPGQKLSTEDPYTLDRQARQELARHFGWPVPQS